MTHVVLEIQGQMSSLRALQTQILADQAGGEEVLDQFVIQLQHCTNSHATLINVNQGSQCDISHTCTCAIIPTLL